MNNSLQYTLKIVSMRALFAMLLALCITSAVYAEVVKEGSFQATSDGANVTLRWLVTTEANVVRYEIEKRSGTDEEFHSIVAVEPRGNSFYEVVDYSAMSKTGSLYQYRIKVVFNDGSNPLYVGPVSVTHSVSGVRKTWGSIKALFR